VVYDRWFRSIVARWAVSGKGLEMMDGRRLRGRTVAMGFSFRLTTRQKY